MRSARHSLDGRARAFSGDALRHEHRDLHGAGECKHYRHEESHDEVGNPRCGFLLVIENRGHSGLSIYCARRRSAARLARESRASTRADERIGCRRIANGLPAVPMIRQ